MVSGHDEQSFASAIQGLEPAGVTLIVLMGIGRSVALASHLVSRGWPADTLAALVFDASMPGQQVWRGTLDDLAQGRAAGITEGASGPGTLVVGEVVSVAEALCQPSMIKQVTAARG